MTDVPLTLVKMEALALHFLIMISYVPVKQVLEETVVNVSKEQIYQILSCFCNLFRIVNMGYKWSNQFESKTVRKWGKFKFANFATLYAVVVANVSLSPLSVHFLSPSLLWRS